MGFYGFNQNNSGGSWVVDHKRGISHYVIVEGASVADVTARAEDIGLYFDGSGDCHCCGQRWSEPWSKLSDTPEIYGTPVEPREPYVKRDMDFKWIKGAEGYIHYLDGRIEPFWE